MALVTNGNAVDLNSRMLNPNVRGERPLAVATSSMDR